MLLFSCDYLNFNVIHLSICSLILLHLFFGLLTTQTWRKAIPKYWYRAPPSAYTVTKPSKPTIWLAAFVLLFHLYLGVVHLYGVYSFELNFRFWLQLHSRYLTLV